MDPQLFNRKIMPFIWLDGKCKEAIDLYTHLFPLTSIEHINYWPEGYGIPTDQVQNACIHLCGVTLALMDSPQAPPASDAISFLVHCKDQEELDKYYNALVHEGVAKPCGWLTDRFGISWQLIPMAFIEMIQNPMKGNLPAMMKVFMTMKRIDIAELEKAYQHQ